MYISQSKKQSASLSNRHLPLCSNFHQHCCRGTATLLLHISLFFLQRFAYVNDSANINHTWCPNKSLLCEPLGPLSEKQRLRQDTGEEAEKKLSAWWLSLCNLNKNKCSKGCQCCELRLIGLSVTMGHPEYRWLIKRCPHLTYEIHCFTKL